MNLSCTRFNHFLYYVRIQCHVHHILLLLRNFSFNSLIILLHHARAKRKHILRQLCMSCVCWHVSLSTVFLKFLEQVLSLHSSLDPFEAETCRFLPLIARAFPLNLDREKESIENAEHNQLSSSVRRAFNSPSSLAVVSSSTIASATVTSSLSSVSSAPASLSSNTPS